jgi:hypothetical protein
MPCSWSLTLLPFFFSTSRVLLRCPLSSALPPPTPPDSRATMGLGPVIPTISNTIGAVIIGWGLSCLYVLVSRDRVPFSHLACAPASSACFASKSGHIINDIQMIVLHTRFWYVVRTLFHQAVLADHRVCAGPLIMVRASRRLRHHVILNMY